MTTANMSIELVKFDDFFYTGEFRIPFFDEYYLGSDNTVKKVTDDCSFYAFILQKYTPPFCFINGWIAMDSYKRWWWFEEKPIMKSDLANMTINWQPQSKTYLMINGNIDWAPPYNIEPEKSLLECKKRKVVCN